MLNDFDLEDAWPRLVDAERKNKTRDQRDEYLGAAFKIMICTFALLEVPWTMIGAIAVAYLKRLSNSKSSPDWPSDKIKRIAREGLALMPNLPNFIDDSNNPGTQRARKWLAECKLALWCVQNNLKGIAVPTALAIDHYVSLWGMGPHVEGVRRHLNQFSHSQRRQNWMQRFKRVWDFDLAMCGRACSLAAAETATKARHIVNPNP